MSDYFAGKHVVVTGAASGVGLALIEELLRRGAATAVMADYNEETLSLESERVARDHPGKVKAVVTDVTNAEAVEHLITEAAAFGAGRIDLLINNAGGPFSGQFEETSDAEWQAAFALNFYGAVHGCRAVVPVMAQQGGGQIVNVISGIAYLPLAYQARYTATKAALHALTQVLRYEYWDLGIKVNSATPGTTKTGIWTEVPPPDYAQTAAESAEHILTGVERNESLIFGDTTDREKYELISNPATSAEGEAWLLDVARKRRAGESGF